MEFNLWDKGTLSPSLLSFQILHLPWPLNEGSYCNRLFRFHAVDGGVLIHIFLVIHQRWGTALHLSRSVPSCSLFLTKREFIKVTVFCQKEVCYVHYFLPFLFSQFFLPLSLRMRSFISIDTGYQTVRGKYIPKTCICNSMAERCIPYVLSRKIQGLESRVSFLIHVGSQQGAKMELWGWLGMIYDCFVIWLNIWWFWNTVSNLNYLFWSWLRAPSFHL